MALTAWVSLSVLAMLLYSRRYTGTELPVSHLMAAILVSVFAGMLGYFAWLMYVPTLERHGEEGVPVARLLAGVATLIPPCVIGVSILPAGSDITPWFAGLYLVVGCFALLSPRQEYLFARASRATLSESRVNWNEIAVRPPDTRDCLDSLDGHCGETTVGVTYARSMNAGMERQGYAPSLERTPAAAPTPQLAPATVATPAPVRTEEPTRARKQHTAPAPVRPAAAREREASAENVFRSPFPAPDERTSPPPAAPEVTEETAVAEAPAELRDFVDQSGSRCIEGIVEAVFRPGQKRTYAHVSFHPLFDSAPELICEVLGSSDARLRSPVAFPYGARLEVSRKHNVDQGGSVRIAFLAQSPE